MQILDARAILGTAASLNKSPGDIIHSLEGKRWYNDLHHELRHAMDNNKLLEVHWKDEIMTFWEVFESGAGGLVLHYLAAILGTRRCFVICMVISFSILFLLLSIVYCIYTAA
jgi:hypothetical protein